MKNQKAIAEIYVKGGRVSHGEIENYKIGCLVYIQTTNPINGYFNLGTFV